MEKAERDRRIAAYQALCRDRGFRNTVQKRTVLETVLELDGHPTADQVHEAVGKTHPEISRTTVYRGLESFVRMGLIAKACHPGRVARYDRRNDTHHHLLCIHCNRFVDFEDKSLDRLEIPDTSAVGFEVSGFSVQLRGTCRGCRDMMGREEKP